MCVGEFDEVLSSMSRRISLQRNVPRNRNIRRNCVMCVSLNFVGKLMSTWMSPGQNILCGIRRLNTIKLRKIRERLCVIEILSMLN